ncbi:DUF4020 domain-containing protein, partial [Bacillus pseudomycoides]|uniref:DUF4020 domain-containing protein n=1 Tax=Bacillus pseudomycoides TaxID=64104 RepID=UPI0015D4F289
AIVTQLELRQSNQDLRLKINEVLKGYLQVMDEILEKGLCIISSKFLGVEGQCNQEEMKQLFTEMLEKKNSMKEYKGLYA